MSDSSATLSLQRVLHVPPDDLYAAFVEAPRLASSLELAPNLAAKKVAVDARGFELEYEAGERGRIVLRGVWRELVPGRRLVFDLTRSDKANSATSPVVVDIEPHGAATLFKLRHEGVHEVERAALEGVWKHGMNRLWGACLEAKEKFFRRLDTFPKFRSQFGGFWPDLTDSAARLAGKHALGHLDATDVARFQHWQEKGYVLLEKAVDPALIDAFRAEIARDWQQGNEGLVIELADGSNAFPRMLPKYQNVPHKVLDYHSTSKLARDIQFAPAIKRFLGQLFERPPMPFQSLLFRYGTEQEMHQDTAYVVVRSPMEFVGCWVALEDITPGSGELQYYEGSHKIPEFLWCGRGRARPPEWDDHRAFLRWVCEKSEAQGCPLTRFHPKKGDALIWHADLVHGGSPRLKREISRWSLVSHYCPIDVDPEWMDRVPHSGRREHAPGSTYIHQMHTAMH